MSDKMNSKKRRIGDRKDGRWIRDNNGLQVIMANLMPHRTDCEVYLQDRIDATELLKYLEKRNSEGLDYKITVFHCAVVGLDRMVRERPMMNRFVQGGRIYERDEVSLGFVARRRFADGAEEALMILTPSDTDTLDDVAKKIYGDVKETRRSETGESGVDGLVNRVARMPRPAVMAITKTARVLDFWGHNPDFLTAGDPNYATILISNLGSIQCPSVYHHLNDYGTNSIVVTIGAIHKEELLMPDGGKEIRDVIDVGATLDERIADGFYFARSLKLIKYIFAHPELLEKPLGEPSGFQYD